MRFKTFYLKEMPQYTDSYTNASNYTIHGRYNKAIQDKKKFKELIYDKYKILRTTGYTKNSFEWFVFIDDVLVANFSSELGLDKVYKFPQITLALVSPEYRNKKIASDIYEYLLNYYGGVISSKHLSVDGGKLLWKSLVSKNNAYEYFPDNKENKITRIKEMPNKSDSESRIIISKKELIK